MLSIQKWIRFLFPNEVIVYHLSDLNNQITNKNDSQKRICLSVEKNLNCRQFCSLTIDQLNILFQHCPLIQRTLYECICSTAPIKLYVDFEYYINHNSDLENEYIPLKSCLKILYYLLNQQQNDSSLLETDIDSQCILKQFLVLNASTNDKISYHVIHAKPLFLFDSMCSLKNTMKTLMEYLLLSVIEHKCKSFNISEYKCQINISNLIQYLSPYVSTLRKDCSHCFLPFANLSVSDIANILIRNKSNNWSTAIDMNVYNNNQQFRLFNCVKLGQNNALILCDKFPFDKDIQYSSFEILQLSLVTFHNNIDLPMISYQDNQFKLNQQSRLQSTNDEFVLKHTCHIDLLNEHLRNSNSICVNKNQHNSKLNSSNLNSKTVQQIIDLYGESITPFITFVENKITCDPIHQGYIYSCTRGKYNNNIVFFNIQGNYRYCPKQKRHHRSNSIAIMVNTRNNTYSIRCKDVECDNTFIEWNPI